MVMQAVPSEHNVIMYEPAQLQAQSYTAYSGKPHASPDVQISHAKQLLAHADTRMQPAHALLVELHPL